MAAKGDVDLPEVRRNLARLAVAQGVLMVVALVAWRFFEGRTAWLALWLAVLPVLVALWSADFYRRLKQASEAGGGKARLVAVNRKVMRNLAAVGLAWGGGLVAIIVYSFLA